MTEIIEEWQEPEISRGVELSIEESQALWDFFQRNDCPPYWEDAAIASVAHKTKRFFVEGPWDVTDRGVSELPYAQKVDDMPVGE